MAGMQRQSGERPGAASTPDPQSLYESLVESLPVYVTRKDTEGRITFVNTLFAELIGMPAGEIVGKTDYDFFPHSLAEKYRRDDRQVMETGRMFCDVEENIVDGHRRFFEVRKTAVRDPAENVVGTQAIFWDVTARKRAELTARESQERLKVLVEHAPEAILILDGDTGRFVRANKNSAKLFKYPLDELLTKTPAELSPPRQADGRQSEQMARFYVQRALQGRTTIFDWLHRDSEGNTIPCEVRLVRLPGKSRRLIRASVLDISERKAAENALKYERYLLHSLLDNIPDSIYFKDRESRFIRVSKGLADKFGLADPQEAIGKTDFDFFSEEHAQPARDDELRVMQTGEPILAKIEQETWRDGRVTWSSTTKLPLRDEEGQIIGTFGITRDVTELHEIEAALAQERDRLQTLMDALPDLIYVKDCDGRFVLANQALLGFLGVQSVDDLYGKTNYDFLPSDLAGRFLEEDRQVIEEGRPLINHESKVIDRHGSTCWFLSSKVPLRDASGQITGVIGIDRNINRRKEAEDVLRRAKEAADAASRAKSDFLANMSHELRTPMNAIIGMTELLLDSENTPSRREYLEVIASSGQTLLAVINDILDFSKIEAGKLDLDDVCFDIRETLGDTMKSLAVRAHAKQIELALRIAPSVPTLVRGDPMRLRQVLINIVGNAIKFTDAGEVVVDVTSEPLESSEMRLRFRVTDTGIGIPADKLQSIFRKFQQADTSTTRRFGGTGLGLAIASRIVEKMGGSIAVRSEVGKGSEFSFDIRLRDGDGKRPSAVSSLAGARVLVVDDHPINLKILHEILSTCQAEVLQASSVSVARDAVQAAQDANRPIDLVISDLNMPHEDGLDLLRWLRDTPATEKIPFILLTSGSRDADRERMSLCKPDRCLLKPTKQNELLRAMLEVLGKSGPLNATPDAGMGARTVRPLRILLAEDNVVNQKLAKALLERIGHHVTLAEDGREAFEARKANDFDLILMDIQMPEIDGLESARLIRSWESEHTRPAIPIIALTAHALKSDEERCYDAGMNGYLAKPVRSAELRASIEQVMANEETVPARRDPVPPPRQPTTLDWSGALESAGGSLELLREVVEAVLTEVPRFRREIEQAIEREDALLLQRAAHSLKGSLSFLGAQALVTEAQRIEMLGKSGSTELSADEVARLEKELDDVLAECRRWLETSENSTLEGGG